MCGLPTNKVTASKGIEPIRPQVIGSSPACCSLPLDPLQVFRQGMQLIHVIGSRIAGVANDAEFSGSRLAQLLRFHRTPRKRCLPTQPQLPEQIVCGFGRAGERPRKNLGMRKDHLLLSGHGIPSKLQEHLQIFRYELRFHRAGVSSAIPGMQSIDEQYKLHPLVIAWDLENRAHRSVAGTPGGQADRTEAYACFLLGLHEELAEPLWICEGAGINPGTGAKLDGDDRRLAVLGRGSFRQPGAAVKMDKERNRALEPKLVRQEQHSNGQGLASS